MFVCVCVCRTKEKEHSYVEVTLTLSFLRNESVYFGPWVLKVLKANGLGWESLGRCYVVIYEIVEENGMLYQIWLGSHQDGDSVYIRITSKKVAGGTASCVTAISNGKNGKALKETTYNAALPNSMVISPFVRGATPSSPLYHCSYQNNIPLKQVDPSAIDENARGNMILTVVLNVKKTIGDISDKVISIFLSLLFSNFS